jgi:hypothetical protein
MSKREIRALSLFIRQTSGIQLESIKGLIDANKCSENAITNKFYDKKDKKQMAVESVISMQLAALTKPDRSIPVS